MSEHTFTEGQKVYHRNLQCFGTFLHHDDLDRSSSHVEFDDDPDDFETRRITTTSLVPVEQAEANL